MCVSSNSTSRTFNVGSPLPVSIIEFAQIVAGLTGSRIEFRDEVFEHSPFDEIVPNISEIQSLGWSPEVRLDEAIGRTINWLKRDF
jgi:nucleoside-diphosphate-sugar epimerase